MNVLLTSIGRRGYLAQYFRQALSGQGQVIAANMHADTSGMYQADKSIVVPPSHHPDYIEHILAICEEHDVRLLCSLHDLDSYILSQHRSLFDQRGILSTLPAPDFAYASLDKLACFEKLRQANFATPWTSVFPEEALEAVNNGTISFPLIIKARFGFGSLGLERCNTAEELLSTHLKVSRRAWESTRDFIQVRPEDAAVIQPLLRGREICLGIVNNFSGVYENHFSCEVNNMRAGESDSATSIPRLPFEHLSRDFSKMTNHRGICGLDLIENDNKLNIIDVNPRFTGDYPFHHLAGADIPKALLAWLSNTEAPASCFQHQPGIHCYKDMVPVRRP